MQVDNEGRIPDSSSKNTRYWFKHDTAHIKKTFAKTVKSTPVLLGVGVVLSYYNGYSFSEDAGSFIKVTLAIAGVLFICRFLVQILLGKGYDVMRKGPFYPKEVTEEDIEGTIDNIEKFL